MREKWCKDFAVVTDLDVISEGMIDEYLTSQHYIALTSILRIPSAVID
jgi:hypothetical protein